MARSSSVGPKLKTVHPRIVSPRPASTISWPFWICVVQTFPYQMGVFYCRELVVMNQYKSYKITVFAFPDPSRGALIGYKGNWLTHSPPIWNIFSMQFEIQSVSRDYCAVYSQ